MALDPLAAEAASIDTALGRLDELARQPRLMPIVAANPATSAETLEKLANSKDEAICRAVAHNPNTPVPVLLRLAQKFPLEFLSNPVLPLLNLSQPDFIKTLPAEGWLQILRYDRVPTVWLKWVYQGLILPYTGQRKAILDELRYHIAIAGEATRGWEKKVRKALQEDTRLLSYFYRVNTQIFLLSILAFPGLAAEWGVELRAGRRKDLQSLVLAHSPELNGQALALLARETDVSIQCAVARHPRTPAKILAKLVEKAADPVVRRAVASNPHAPLKLLRRLAGDAEAPVRQAVSHHPHLPLEMLETLALDADFIVRAAAASHSKLSLEIYQLLVNDFDSTVRATLARNVHAPGEVLLALARDARVEVRAAVARNPRLPAEAFILLFHEGSAPVRQSLASNPQLPLPLLEQLSTDPDPIIRRSLAANPRTPLALLETWLQEEINKESWFTLVQNPSALLKGPNQPGDRALLIALARNPRVTPAMLTRLAEYRSGRAKKLVDLRAAVAAHTRTPVDVLRKLATYADSAIARSLAANPHTPLDVLSRMLDIDDMELWVRIAHHPAVIGDQRHILIDLLIRKIRQERTSSSLPTWFFFQHQELPETSLNDLLNSTSWRDRYLVARHPKASQEMLTALARDGNRFVRVAARTALINRARLTKRGRTKRDS